MYCAQGTQTAVIRVSDWEEARRIGKSLRRWLFRGQRKAEWSLESSLERAFERETSGDIGVRETSGSRETSGDIGVRS